MKKFSLTRGWGLIVLICSFPNTSLFSQSVVASPQNIIRPSGTNTVNVTLDRLTGGWGNSGTYAWSVSPATGVTIGSYSQTNPNAADVTVTFSSAAVGAYTFTLTRGGISASTTVRVGNIAGATGSGSSVSAFLVNNGTSLFGPGNIFNTTVSTSALGLSASGHFYYLPNTFTGNDGRVTVYAANPNGTGSTAIAQTDLNGASNNDLGFVRLAIDPNGTGWILAGDNSQLYLGSFVANGLNPTTIQTVDPTVTLVNGTVSTFFNGDICFSGSGTIYALANSGSGVTQIFTGTPNGTSTTLTKKWDLVNQNGNPFTGSVNGVAFDAAGSLYISTSTGLYFIDQYTVNTATGTVQCALVSSLSGLTDLASNFYPQQSTLPVTLVQFTGLYRTPHTVLNWETTAEINFDRFEIERSTDGRNFSTIGTRAAMGNSSSRQSYQFSDDLSGAAGSAFTYRLKLVDIDGKFQYSNVVLVRKDALNISGVILNPSPVGVGNSSTIRFNAMRTGKADLRVLDMSGKTVWRQQVQVFDGVNSVPFKASGNLIPGAYVLQLNNDEQTTTFKFSITQ